MIIGHDFRFGQRAEGDAEWSRARAAEFGLSVEVVEPVKVGDQRVGSRLVRQALAAGDMAQAFLMSSTWFIELDAAVWSDNRVRVMASNASAATFDLAAVTRSLGVTKVQVP